MPNTPDPKDTTLMLIRLGDYAGKAIAKKVSEDFKVKQALDTWLGSKPNISDSSENGIAHFMQNFLSPIFRELFEGSNAKIKMQILSNHTLLRGIDFEFTVK